MLHCLDMQGSVLAVSDLWLSAFGYRRDEVIGQLITGFLTAPSREYSRDIVLPAFLANGQCEEIEYRMVRKDGTLLDVLISARIEGPRADSEVGREPRILALIQDVTQRRIQEEALRKSEAFLDRASRVAGMGAWEIDLATNTPTWSDETCRILRAPIGYRPTLEDGFNLYPPESRPLIVAAMNAASDKGEGFDLEIPVNRLDGSRFLARVVGGAELREGRPIRLTGAFQDITVQVAEREALELAHDRLAVATESGGIGIWEWDIQNDKVVCDARMYLLQGMKPQETTANLDFWKNRIHPEDRGLVELALAHAMEAPASFDVGFRVVWDDGSVHHLQATAHVTCDKMGLPLRMVGANWDVTDLASQRLVLRAAERVTLATDSGGIGIWEWDLVDDIITCDSWMFRLYGLPPSRDGRWSYAAWRERLHPDDLGPLELAVRESLETGRPYDAEFRIVWNDGSVHWIHGSGKVAHDETGRTARFVGTNRDITEKRQREAAAAYAKHQIDSIGRTQMIAEFNMDGTIQRVNRNYLDAFGYEAAEIEGQSHSMLVTEHYGRSAAYREFWAGLRAGEFQSGEYERVGKNGRIVWIDASYNPILDRMGNPDRILKFATIATERVEGRRRVREAESRLRALYDSVTEGLISINATGVILSINPAGATMFAYEAEELIGQNIKILMPEPDRSNHDGHLAGYKSGGEARILGLGRELQGLAKSGRTFPIEVTLSKTLDESLPLFLGQVRDITQRKQSEVETQRLNAELAEQHELLRITLQSIGDGVITADREGHVTWLNPVAERMTGWKTADAIGRPMDQVFHILHERTRERAESPVAACLARQEIGRLPKFTLLISRNGEEFGIEDSVAPIASDSGELLGVVLVFHDVTEQRRLSGEMSHRATHDAVTGLINRSEFEARLHRLLQSARADGTDNALLYLDLDQFKIINDTCGHAVGDQLLLQVSKLLSSLVRASDTVARLGGDEFAILLSRCPATQAHILAQRICERMDDFRFIHDEKPFRIGVSIGLVPVDGRWANAASIMQAADTSCYAAKEAGRNCVHTWSDNQNSLRERLGETQWAVRLENALDEGSFLLFAQRIMTLDDESSGIYAEVLIRMAEPDGSLIYPGAFLPAAERFHLISRIDRWVLNEVFLWMNSQPSVDFLQCLNVNVSGQSIGDRAFHRWAVEVLGNIGAAIRAKLCIEITETSAVTNLADAAIFIRQVRALGVRVALDDFGAGTSWFGYLKKMPVDVLKIDGQFIRDLVTDPLADATVRCFAEVAKVLRITTVAEFVENIPTLQRLRDIGIDFAQGYLIHKPAPINQLADPARQLQTPSGGLDIARQRINSFPVEEGTTLLSRPEAG